MTFVGSHDPYNPDKSNGPILSYVNYFSDRGFHKIYFFYESSEYLARGHELSNIVKKKFPNTNIHFVRVDVSSPTDYEDLFRGISISVAKIEKENKEINPEYFILTDSGTPQMQTCWILLVASNLFKAHLIQGVPAKFAGGIYKPKEINLNFKDFPIILKPPEIDKLNKILLEEPTIEHIEKDKLIGNEKLFISAKAKTLQAAKYDISVLLMGETGTGKELFARLIHNNSTRKDKPFIPVNCSAVNIQIAESEFFGHKKGAFTGAINNKEGLFSVADGGTIFLDEIGDLPLELQPKLLRVLEDGTFTPVGETKAKKVNIRVIAATNKNLLKLVKKEKFRQDLFERLNEYIIELPPLRKRKNDIPLLIQYFLNKWNKKYNEN
ncbi:MAG: RNA repair transcriptional activator RtcR family protein, partial [Candidatus Heimdallarchaeaceae archaeon]